MGHAASGCAVLCTVVMIGIGGLVPLISASGSESPPPHIVMVLIDDLGYNSLYNNARTFTPFVDALAHEEGVKLDEAYAYMYCSPSRGSLLTARSPFHLEATRQNLIPWSLAGGINLTYNMLPVTLKKAGYKSYHVGKWHQGFVTPEYTPVGRGFDHSFGFLEGGEDHWTSATFNGPKCKPNGVDLSFGFRNGSEIVVKPALGMNGTYTGYLFNDAAVKAVHESAAPGSPPLFLYYAMHNTHAPVEAPENYVGLYNNTPWAGTLEQTFNAQVSFVDDALKNLTTALKETGMWNNSLVVVQTDNGAPVTVAGSNLPLKGGKGSSWEGGTRTPAFVTGGILPQAMRGQTLKGMAHISDWYATFAGRAGLPAQADPAGPAKPDSHDLWPWLSGQAPKSPRVTMVYDHRMYADPGNATAAVGAMRVGNLKLVHGPFKQASWYGVFSPNSTQPKPSTAYTQCSIEQPCLFDLDADPTEHVDIAQQRPDDVKQLTAQFRALADEYHPPPHGPPEETRQYCDAMHNNHDFVAPWKMQQGHE